MDLQLEDGARRTSSLIRHIFSSVKSDVEFNSLLEMRRQRQFPLFQEGGQMIADKAKLSGNEFALLQEKIQTSLQNLNLDLESG